MREVDKLPDTITGIDLQQGLKQMMGKSNLYLKILKKFMITQTQAVTEIQAQFNSGDLEAAERGAHTLKGTASTIGANELGKSAAVLESALKGKFDASIITPLIHTTGQDLDKLMQALRDSLYENG